MGARDPKDPSRNRCAILAADASCLAALLVAYILPVCAPLAPCQAGASTPRTAHLFLRGSYARETGGVARCDRGVLHRHAVVAASAAWIHVGRPGLEVPPGACIRFSRSVPSGDRRALPRSRSGLPPP